MQKVFPISMGKADIRDLEVIDVPATNELSQLMTVQIVDPEFSAVCPKTGLPDYGTVVLQYIHRDHRVELKSWKLYLRDFYGVGCFHENITQKIMAEFVRAVQPYWVRLTIVWGARGGLHTTTQMVWSSADLEGINDGQGHQAHPSDFKDPSYVAREWTNR